MTLKLRILEISLSVSDSVESVFTLSHRKVHLKIGQNQPWVNSNYGTKTFEEKQGVIHPFNVECIGLIFIPKLTIFICKFEQTGQFLATRKLV